MLVAFPFHAGDAAQLLNLLTWIQQLGGAHNHSALLVADAGVDWETCVRAQKLAGQSFSSVEIITNEKSVKGWPQGPNSLFSTAARHCYNAAKTWLWMETDAVPLHREWVDVLENEYTKRQKAFLGHVYDCAQPGLPKQCLSGVAVYSHIANQYICGNIEDHPDTAFDVSSAAMVVPHAAHTERIQHFWGEPNLPPSFPQRCVLKHHFSLDKLQPNAVIFHRNKDGTLIDRLRERAGIRPKVVQEMSQPARGTISVRRTAALGDVLASTVVARKLMEQGFDVVFQAHPSTHCILRRVVPPLKAITEAGGNVAVNLDGAYESHPRRREMHFAEMFVERANSQMSFKLGNAKNFAPRMQLTEDDRFNARETLMAHPFPHIIIVPRSNSWANRTVPDETWAEVCSKLPGTKFWLALHPAPGGVPGLVDLNCRHFDRAIGYLGLADLVVTVDTGPMHVAAALGTPVVAIQQASSPELHLSDQRDWVMVSPVLNCLNCQIDLCPINPTTPPCQNISADAIARVANEKLQAITGRGVSCVIAVYKPNVEKLNRCLEHVLPQVNEVVIVSDMGGMVPRGAMQHPKIRYLRMKQRDVGYGRKANHGFRHTNHRYVLLLNDDLYLAPDAVAKMKECMAVDVGMVAHLLHYPDGTIQHGGTYRAPGVPGWGHIDHRAREHRFKEPLEMENVCGASVLVRRQAFYDAGGFDEDFFLYCEDNALCLAVRRAGWRIMYTPHATGIHDESQSTSVTPGIYQIMQQSQQTLKEKWGWYFELNKHNSMGVFE